MAKSLNPNPLNRKNQNGIYNPFFSKSKEITPNGLIWMIRTEQNNYI